MRDLARTLFSTVVVVATSASCNGPAATPTSQSQPAVFPLTISRTGGVAGFQDVLVVTGDGLVSATHKGEGLRRCQLTPGAVQRLATAAAQVPWPRITPAGPQASFPDDLVSTVQSPAGGPVRLDGPLAGHGGQVILELLNELSDNATASRTCPPV